MRLRNNIFAAAFDYLKRNKGIKTQKQLAERMGVSQDTITRILKGYSEVTEDIITKLQTASGCIFNLQWLRGEDPNHMLAVDVVEDFYAPQPAPPPPQIDQSSLLNAALAAQMETIASLKQTIDDMKEQHARELSNMIDQHHRELAEKDAHIADLTKLADERLHRIAELRRVIDSSKINMADYPFTIGSAESQNNHKRR